MSLFPSKTLVKELNESKLAFTNLEKEFNDFKTANAEFESEKAELTSKLSTYEAEVTAVKSERDSLAADLATAKESIKSLETKTESVTAAALLELEKVGQAPVTVAPVSKEADEAKLWEDYMAITEPEKRRAFYEKNIKGKK